MFGFLLLVDYDPCKPTTRLSYYVVDEFRGGTCSIHTMKGVIKITKQTVHDMFGLPCDGVALEDLEECPKDDKIVQDWKKQYLEGDEYKYNNENYLDRIRESEVADELFKLNFLTLFINTFCETELMGLRKINFLEKLARCNDIHNIDWCKYMIDCLVRTKYKWKRVDKYCNYIGPQTLLLVS